MGRSQEKVDEAKLTLYRRNSHLKELLPWWPAITELWSHHCSLWLCKDGSRCRCISYLSWGCAHLPGNRVQQNQVFSLFGFHGRKQWQEDQREKKNTNIFQRLLWMSSLQKDPHRFFLFRLLLCFIWTENLWFFLGKWDHDLYFIIYTADFMYFDGSITSLSLFSSRKWWVHGSPETPALFVMTVEILSFAKW